MKKLLQETQTTEESGTVQIKRYWYDTLKPNHVVIEQVQKTGEIEKKISELIISLENAPAEVQKLVSDSGNE